MKLTILISISALGLFAQAPGTDVLMQVLNQKLQKLIPGGTTERSVLFQEVRAGAPNGGSYPFQVTAVIHDYGPGYPKNRYYGETCVGHYDKLRFELTRDEFGGWDVQGPMTPELRTRQCKPNLAAGQSSIPLASLQGTAAPSGTPATAPPVNQAPTAAAVGAVAMGTYECWANGSARGLMNFSIRSANQYVGSDGKPGTLSYNPASTQITFTGGALDGIMPTGFKSIYYAPQGRPTVSFRGPGGGEASFCQRVR